MTTKKPVTDPLADAHAALEAARSALKSGETDAATRRETVNRLIDAAKSDLDINIDTASVEIATAREAADLAEARLPALREAVTTAEGKWSALNTQDVLARVSAMPEVNDEALRDAVATLETAYAKAEADLWMTLRQVQATRTRALAEAKAAGITWIEQARVRTDRGLVRPHRGLVTPLIPRESSPQRIIAGVRAGDLHASQYVAASRIDTADQVDAEAAEYAREALSCLFGVPVEAGGLHDPSNDTGGVWAAINSVDIQGENVQIRATVLGDGARRLKRHDSAMPPVQYGPILLLAARADGPAGMAFTVIDARLAADDVNPQSVADAVTAALAKVDPERFGSGLGRRISHDDYRIVATAKRASDAAVTLGLMVTRDGQGIAQRVDSAILNDALIGLPVPGAGIIESITPGEGVSYTVRFARGDADEESEAA